MPKNNTTNVIHSNTPCVRCQCGWEKSFERQCDKMKGFARHARFCEISKRPIMAEYAAKITVKRDNIQTTIISTVASKIKVSKKA